MECHVYSANLSGLRNEMQFILVVCFTDLSVRI